MPSQYKVTEPHPHFLGGYAHSGRGGAGNSFKAPITSNGATATGPASLFEHGLPSSSSSRYSSGRGGAGNITKNQRIFSFDEEIERQTTREKNAKSGSAWYVGRGGAGNFAKEQPSSGRKDSISSSSSESSNNGRPNFFSRLSSEFKRH